MNRLALLSLLTATLALSTNADAQTRAEVLENRGCVALAPADTLLTQVSAPQAWTVDSNGVGVIEIESVPPASGWVEETTYPGFTGDSYYKWVGGNLWSRPGSGVMTYRFFVENPGNYQVRIHNRHNHPDPSLENDCWMRVNGSNWIKTYSNTGRNSRVWNWHFRFDPGHTAVRYNFQRGLNEVQISGRSNGFMLDRLVIFPSGQTGEDLTLPESDRLRERPVIGQTMRLVAHDWGSSFGLVPGATAFQLAAMPGSGPNCGPVLRGWGPLQGGVSRNAEWLLDPSRTSSLGDPLVWNGQRLVIPLQIPNQTALIGGSLSIQGAFLQFQGGLEPMLTKRLELVFGDY